jgi:hypothetical protein
VELVSVAVFVVIVVVVIGAMFVLQWYRRGQANRAAQQLGGAVVTGPLPFPHQPYAQPPGNVGLPNPALPPAAAPDQRSGVATSGPPVELRICGLPALAWQRGEWGQYTNQPMRLSLIVDTAVGLPMLQLFSQSALLHASSDVHGPIGIAQLDEHFRAAGDLDAWRPVLAMPTVWQALVGFPLQSVSVFGGRFTFVSKDGVHLDPGAASGIAQVAAAMISAVPPQITSAAAAPPPTAVGGADLRDSEAVVRNVLSKSGLSPEQQAAMMQLIQRDEH